MSAHADVLLTILGMAAVTYLTRISFFVLAGRVEFPSRLRAGLRYLPIGVLTALIVPAVLAPRGVSAGLDFSLNNVFLPAALVATVVARLTRNPLFAMAAGMVVVVAGRLLLASR